LNDRPEKCSYVKQEYKTMPYLLLEILMVCLIAGVILWAIGQFPLPAPIGQVVRVVVIVVVAIWLIYLLFGMLGGMPYPMYPHR
jgi:hypothetical protein